MRPFAMTDIAPQARISPAVVSRAIRSPHQVNLKTRQLALRIIREHRSHRHATGKSSFKKSNEIGVLIPTSHSPVFARSTMIIQEYAQEKGFSILLGITKYDAAIEKNLLQGFKERRVAGIILAGYTFGQEKLIRELMNGGIPTVVIWEKPSDETLNFVGFDNFKAAYSLTEYLIGLKHHRIGMICGPFSKVDRVRKRLEGYIAALEAHGLEFDPSLVIEKEPTLYEGQEAMWRLLSRIDRPTAVIAANDILAIGALTESKNRGISVPRDLSLAAFDDFDFAAFCDPSLSTVLIPGPDIGLLAAQHLIDLIERGSRESKRYCLNTGLVIRKSCAELKT